MSARDLSLSPAAAAENLSKRAVLIQLLCTAFLTSLHTNIFLEDDSDCEVITDHRYSHRLSSFSEPPSPVTSSSSMSSYSDIDVAPPSALRIATPANEDKSDESFIGQDGVPILKTWSATTTDDKVEALHLIADSVAQQRNIASRALIYHPVTLAVVVAMFALIRQQFYKGDNSDYIKIITTFVGCCSTLLVSFRYICGPYINEAERVGTWRWLDEGRSRSEEEQTGVHVLGDQDEILLTRFGPDHIGTIVFRGVQPASSGSGNKKTRRAQSPSKQTKMQIRGWSVAQKFRRKEIGTALLDEALKIGEEKGWTVGGVELAENHANHKRVLPKMFNGALDKFSSIAQKTLDKRLDAFEESKERARKKR